MQGLPSIENDENRNDEETTDSDLLLAKRVQVYRIRWFILLVFGLITMSNGCIWISLSSVTDLVQKYYQVKPILVDWLSLSFFVAPSFMAVPGTFILARLGLKINMALPAAFHTLGTAIRIGGMERKSFVYVIIGQAIASFGTIFILAIPPRLATVWFGEKERTSATTIGVLMNPVGISIGFLLTTYLVPDSSNIDEIGAGLKDVFLIHAIWCAVVFILVLIFVRNAPPTPPSWSEALRMITREDQPQPPFFSAVASLLQNVHYVMVTISYSLNFGMVFSLPTLLNQMVRAQGTETGHHKFSEKSVGWVGFIGPLGGIVGSLIASTILDRYKRYKLVTSICILMTTLLIVGFFEALFHGSNIILIGAVFTALCFHNFPYLGYGLDHIAEISYPVSVGASAAAPMVCGNLLGFLQIFAFQVLIDKGHLTFVYYAYVGLGCLSFVLSCIAKTQMKRHCADVINEAEAGE